MRGAEFHPDDRSAFFSLKNESPGTRPGLCCLMLAKILEAVVQAGAHDVRGELDIVRSRGAASGAAAEVAEIDIEIFELGSPRTVDRIFEAGTQRPADLHLAGTRITGHVCADVAISETARDEGHEAVHRETDAAARG